MRSLELALHEIRAEMSVAARGWRIGQDSPSIARVFLGVLEAHRITNRR